MRKVFFLLMIIAIGHAATAQYPGYTAVADLAKFKTEFSTATQKTTSVKSSFVQEKNLAMLSEKIVSKGQFWFKKASQVRMEYTTPYQYLMILNKDKVYIKDGQKESKVSTKSNKLFQQINKMMIDCMQGTAFNNTDFTTRVFENKTTALIELLPVVKGLKDLFKSITVVVDKKDFSVNTLEMQELTGDNTIIRFTNKELNAALPDALFAIK